MDTENSRKPGRVEWEAPDGSRWTVHLTWFEGGERAEVDSVKLHSEDWPPRPITSVLWRSVPIASLIDEDRRRQAEGFGIPAMDAAERHLFTTTNRRGRTLVGEDGAPLPTHEALARVAEIYREAWGRGDNPTKAVAEALSLSRPAASRRVRRARDAGLLPQTTRGKAMPKNVEG